jgi:hypothetical protein
MTAPPRGKFALTLAIAALALLGSSCSKVTKPIASAGADGLPLDAANDMAQQVALMMSSDYGSPVSAAATPFSSAPVGPAFLSADNSAGDTTIVSGAITWAMSRRFFAAGGANQSVYDPETTELMIARFRGTGVVGSRTGPFTFRGIGRLDVRGLSSGSDTLSTSGFAYDTTRSAVTVRTYETARFYYVECAATLANVRQLKPAALHPWPISGAVLWTISADRLTHNVRSDVEAHFDVSAVIYFDGTQTPYVEMNDGYAYRFDLKTGAITRL